MKPIILIKIGGSLITDKNKPFTVNQKALDIIACSIKQVAQQDRVQLILGHGGGSFPHVPAKKYQTQKGVINSKSFRGIAEVQEAAAQLNRIVIKTLLGQGINAVSISPSSSFMVKNNKIKKMFLAPIKKLLEFKMLPVLYGDVVLDEKQGCVILSTERVLGFLGRRLQRKGYQIKRIIHCGQTNGVYDQNGKTIPLINRNNFEKYKKGLNGAGGIDVTGGMLHKVEESLKMAQKGIPALIIDGVEKGSLLKAIEGKKVLGTRIEK